MEKEQKGLPFEAYEVVDGNNYPPYIPPDEKIPEITLKGTILGIILSVIFGVAMVYVGLKAGMTISVSIPAAVISMAVLRGIFRSGTILENNVVQTIATSGGSVASGIIFTVPAVYLWGKSVTDFGVINIIIISIAGGILGVLMMIPLRPYLMVKEHGKLKYPEGTACAEVLVAGDAGGKQAVHVFIGIIVGAIFKFCSSALHLWKDSVSWDLSSIGKKPFLKNLVFSGDISPIMLGVGYIIGLEVSAYMFAGGLLAWFVLIPMITYFGVDQTAQLAPVLSGITKPIFQMTPDAIWANYIKFIGAGAVAIGGLISLSKSLPTIVSSFKAAGGEFLNRIQKGVKTDSRKRTFEDIPLPILIVLTLILVLIIASFLTFVTKTHLSLLVSLLIVIFSFFFVTVSSRLVGLIGSSSNPVSGMTIGTLLASSLILLVFGATGEKGMFAALMIGSFVCVAMCLGGDVSQDLKTGFLVGSTPKALQIGQIIGVIASSIFVAYTLVYLQMHVPGGLGGKDLPAPQATLISMIIKGIFEANLPWSLVIMGGFIAIIIELLGIPALPVAVGFYLPLSLSTPIMIGGILNYILTKIYRKNEKVLKEKIEKGILIASGLIAGDALVGLLIIGLTAKEIDLSVKWSLGDTNYVAAVLFIILCMILFSYIKKDERS